MNLTPTRAEGRRRDGRRLLSLGMAVATAALVVVPAGAAHASSHREAPLTAGDPQVDNTDVYAFVSPDQPEMVNLVANWLPFEEPNGGPNFYSFAPDAHYDINIDSQGTGKPDITFRWTFKNTDTRANETFLYNNGPVNSLGDPTLLFKQTYTLEEIKAGGQPETLLKDAPVAPSDVGAASMPNYAALRDQAINALPNNGGKSFAGQAADPFFLDLRIFDLLYGTNLKEAGHDTLAGYNVQTIALQVPKAALALKGDAAKNPVVGVWSSTERQTLQLAPGKATATGDFVQVSRLGSPLVNEVVVPAGLKNAFNSITPDMDHTVQPVVDRVNDPEVPKLLNKIYGLPAPAAPRTDLAEIFLTGICKACGPIAADLNSQMLNGDVTKTAFVPAEELRLNMSIAPTASPNRLGVLAKDLQGFPNGRRLADDVVDIELQALEGAAQTGTLVPALAAGDGVNTNPRPFGAAFPYVALPYSSSVNQASSAGVNAAGQGGATGVSPSAAAMPGGGVATGAGGLAGSGRSPLVPLGVGAMALLVSTAFVLRRKVPALARSDRSS